MQFLQPPSSVDLALCANDGVLACAVSLRMAATTRIHQGKTPRRKHFIPEWAEVRHLKQADIARDTGADKGTVSRWFAGNLPQDQYLDAVVGCLSLDSRDALFRHPDDDWMAKFLRNRSAEERERIKQMLEAAFPKKVA